MDKTVEVPRPSRTAPAKPDSQGYAFAPNAITGGASDCTNMPKTIKPYAPSDQTVVP